jgi:hypothetical protein
LHSSIDFYGSAPAGLVEIDGIYGRRPAWHELASARVTTGGTYSASVLLRRRGLLHVRVLYADGSRAAGAVRVK